MSTYTLGFNEPIELNNNTRIVVTVGSIGMNEVGEDNNTSWESGKSITLNTIVDGGQAIYI